MQSNTKDMKARTLILAVAAMLAAASARAQDIRDTFYDIQFGSWINADEVASWVGDAATYKYTTQREKFTEVIFFDAQFEDSTWNMADLYLNGEGRFYRICLMKNFNDGDAATEAFDALKADLDQKYKLTYKRGNEANMLYRYDGSNGVKLMLTFSQKQSLGGELLFYINMDFIHWEMYQAVNSQ